MKKLLAILVISAAAFGCSDDNDNNNNNGPTGLAKRMVGTWDMTELSYSTQIPNPLDPFNPIDATGDAQNVDGVFSVRYNPDQTVVYNYSFTIVDSDIPVPVPVSRSGEAEWEVIGGNTKVVMEEDGETIIYDVITNEPNRQVWSGTVPTEFQGFSFDSDIVFTLEKR